jgi:hypothetical protein
VAVLLVAAIDWLTNDLNTAAFSWDFRYYIDMATRGLEPPLASPFAYRYVTPLLVHLMSLGLHTRVQSGFYILARVFAVAQLVGVFVLAYRHGKSERGAWVAMFVVAFSLFQVKYLLYDPFRPDVLAYPLLLLQVNFALDRKFWPLFIATLLGCQIREFNAIPLLAYGFVLLSEAPTKKPAARRAALLQAGSAGVALAAAMIIPRLLIPVAEDFQFVGFSRDGILRGVLAPFILSRDANFLYALIAYALPLFMLAGPRALARLARSATRSEQVFFGTYSGMVLAGGFFGGTDFQRFMTYLLPASALMTSRLVDESTDLHLMAILAAVFVFNRIWLPFPGTDLGSYLDFFSGFGTRFNMISVLRFAEWTLLVALGLGLRRALSPGRGRPLYPAA